MYNRVLEYLLKNNPEEVLSKRGIRIRKFISPAYRKIMMLFTDNNLKIVRKGNVPKDKRIIYACTHGFHDDIIYSMKTANRHAYLLYGSLLDFFYSFHGLGLWVNGVMIVNRKDKQSKKAAVEKMKKASSLGADIVMFPEATWNKNESIPVQKLYPGIYKVAEESDVLVVPIATVLDNDRCYSIEGDAYDITDIDDKMSLEILKCQITKINKVKDLLIYSCNGENSIRNILNYLLNILLKNDCDNIIKTIKIEYPNYIELFNKILSLKKGRDIYSLDNSSQIEIIDTISLVLSLVTKEVNLIRTSDSFEKDSIYDSILKRSEEILKTASRQKSLTAVSHLRDKMSSLVWELYRKGDRKEFYPNYWDDYIDSLIETTNGLYDYDIENIAEYKDPDEVSLDEVYSTLDNVPLTNKNATVLCFIKNRKRYPNKR